MFVNESTDESKSGEVEINDFEPKTMENMIQFMYNDKILNMEEIDSDLLRLADKYHVTGLVEFCIEHLKGNLTPENALDVLVAAHLTNKNGLFQTAAEFVRL